MSIWRPCRSWVSLAFWDDRVGMRRLVAIACLLTLGACGQPASQPGDSAEQDRLQAQLNQALSNERAAKDELNQIRSADSKHAAKGQRTKAAVVEEGPMDDIGLHADPEQDKIDARRGQEQCWQGYCPCDETATYDRMLCRNLRGGVPVSAVEMSSGATQRDARIGLKKWNSENPDQAIPITE